MVLNRIRRSLANDSGAATPMILAIILLILIGFVALFQFFYTNIILNTIHESCYSVAESVLVSNAETSYQAKRDGYTGIWYLDGSEISNPTVYIDPGSSLAKRLDLVSEGEDLVKTDGGKQIYRLHDIHVSIENPSFQNNKTSLVATVSLIADVRLNFPLINNIPISVPIVVSAAWDPKF